jgi:hypothetical protein
MCSPIRPSPGNRQNHPPRDPESPETPNCKVAGTSSRTLDLCSGALVRQTLRPTRGTVGHSGLWCSAPPAMQIVGSNAYTLLPPCQSSVPVIPSLRPGSNAAPHGRLGYCAVSSHTDAVSLPPAACVARRSLRIPVAIVSLYPPAHSIHRCPKVAVAHHIEKRKNHGRQCIGGPRAKHIPIHDHALDSMRLDLGAWQTCTWTWSRAQLRSMIVLRSQLLFPHTYTSLSVVGSVERNTFPESAQRSCPATLG